MVLCRIGRGVFVFDEDFFASPLVSELPDGLRSNANPILRLEESQRGVRILSYRSQRNKKQPSFVGSVVLLFGAGRGIRTPVALGLTVFKNLKSYHGLGQFRP